MLHCVKEFLLHSGKNFFQAPPQRNKVYFIHSFVALATEYD
jgi:imidazoleglycerol phosphate synthase glutamine amidotransferase subunit HisH